MQLAGSATSLGGSELDDVKPRLCYREYGGLWLSTWWAERGLDAKESAERKKKGSRFGNFGGCWRGFERVAGAWRKRMEIAGGGGGAGAMLRALVGRV
jgi:hypothetical protein